jgi:dinuclear metal center YbgI/SA1388 family protein
VNGVSLTSIAEHVDALLRIGELPDYPNALNGVQLANRRPITHIAAAVDVSSAVIDRTIDSGADLLLVHHGMFWRGVQPIRGPLYDRLKRLIDHDVAVYSAHLPLDAHPELGNNVLLARKLGLSPSAGFATYRGFAIGVRGEDTVETSELVERARTFARRHGGDVRVTRIPAGRFTRRWAVCTGGGATSETLVEATTTGIDTLIVGEGPHWTAVEAADTGLAIIYGGHYATETLGVQALAERIAATFGIRWSFIEAPTGL